MRTARWGLIAVLGGLLAFGFSGCQQVRKAKGPDISQEEIRQLMAPRPFPPDPQYVVATQPCVFFVRGSNGVLTAVQTLRKGQIVILVGIQGAWNDVQTLQGSVGRVMGGSLRVLTPEEASRLH